MKLLRNRRKMVVVSLVMLLAVLAAGPVLAGGWATITLDELPGEIHAGESFEISFMVHQHGKTPVHSLTGWDPNGPFPVEPVISGSNMKTGQTIEFTAVPDESEVGRFQAEIVFPGEGEWSWTIEPRPLAGATELAPLTILPELKSPVVDTVKGGETASVEILDEAIAAEPVPVPATIPAESGWTAVLPWIGGLLLVVGTAMMGLLLSRRKQQATVAVDSGD